MTGAATLEVENLSAGYNARPALEDVTFAAPAGCMIGLLGPNGSGKSTLIKALMGLLPVRRGSALILGRPPKSARDRVGYMPQAEDVDWSFPATASDVVAMGLYRPGRGLRALFPGTPRAVTEALERLGAADLANRQIGELSGGQQRRVLLARALVKHPDVLLLDEPTAGLDAPAEEALLDLLRAEAEAGRTILVATHDISCVQRLFDYALCLNRTVVAFGPPGDTLTADTLSATFGSHIFRLVDAGRSVAVEPHVEHREH